MRRASAPSRATASAALALALAPACGARDAIVGAGLPRGADGGVAGAVLFSSELASDDGAWDVFTPLPGARVTFGVAHAGAGSRDGRVAALVYPGDPALTAADRTDSDLNTGISTKQYFQYGTFRGRVQLATCAPEEDIASAVFMYFTDGGDANANGIADLHELDLQVLCGAPSVVVMTAWSDYELAASGAEVFRKLSHAVDTATGDVYDTPAPNERAFAKTGNDPTLVHPGFPAQGTFYEVGIERAADHVRFFAVLDGSEVTLWTLGDVTYVPQVPLPLMFNLWHPGTHWVPSTTPANYPAHDGVLLVDYAEWRAP